MKKTILLLMIFIIVLGITACQVQKEGNFPDTDQSITDTDNNQTSKDQACPIVAVSCESFYVESEDIILTLGLGIHNKYVSSDSFYLKIMAMDENDPENDLYYKNPEVYSDIYINESAGEYTKSFYDNLEEFLCPNKEDPNYVEEIHLKIPYEEEGLSGKIVIVFYYSYVEDFACDGRALRLYYYVGENGIGFSFDSVEDAMMSREKIKIEKVNKSPSHPDDCC